MNDRLLLHATAIAIEGHALLLRGASGSGKSDLALRLIDAGARLVADDQSELYRSGDRVIVRAPATIAGLLEVRGIGIFRLDPLSIERLPAPHTETILGVALPLVRVTPFDPSAAAKLRLALRAFTEPGLPAIMGK